MICPNCNLPILVGEPWTWQEDASWGMIATHEPCADPEDAEAAIAAGNYEPGEDYPHGDY